VLGEAVLGADDLRCGLEHERRVAQGRERHPPDAVRIAFGSLGCCLECKPGLARPAGPGEGEQARVLVGEEREHLGELALPAQESGCRHREVRAVEAFQRRKVVVSELEDALGGGEVLQAVLPEVRELELDERRCRRRDEHLATVPARGDARRSIDVRADVALVREQRRPRVHSHPHRDRAGGERVREVRGGGDSRRCGREGEEESVPLGVDLDSALRSARLADHPSVLGERLRVPFGTELVQKPRRPLHVGEQEGDGAGGQVATHLARTPRARGRPPGRP